MFERFTDRARRVVVLAQEEARLLGHIYIGTEHLLLGLLHEGEGVAAKVLADLGLSLAATRGQVEEIIGVRETQPQGHLPFTPRAKKVFEFTLRESLQLGHNYQGTEHILLGLVREGEGIAAQILTSSGVDLATVPKRVIEKIHEYAKPPSPQYLRSPGDDPTYIDADLPGVVVLIHQGWTLVKRVIGPTICPECNTPHTCDRYVAVEAAP